MVRDSNGQRAREMDSFMNTKQHITNCFQRFTSVVLLGGFWHLGSLIAELCKAEPVAIRAMKPVMPCRHDDRGKRKA